MSLLRNQAVTLAIALGVLQEQSADFKSDIVYKILKRRATAVYRALIRQGRREQLERHERKGTPVH